MDRRQSNRRNGQRPGLTVYEIITERILAQLEAGTVPVAEAVERSSWHAQESRER